MKTKRSTNIIIGLIMSIAGIGAIILGSVFVINYFKKSKTYVETKGVVVDYEIKGGYDEDPYDDYFDENLSYAPVVLYIVDGVEYTTVHDVSSNVPEYFIGQYVTLKYNPNNPEDVIFKFNNGYWILFVAGILFAGCGLPMMFINIFKKNKNKA